jgi:putative efflux protein, MATE family
MFFEETKEQFKIALPTTAGLLLYKIPWIISLHFVGAIGPEELAAAALATTLCNVTGMSLSVGLSTAITTLTGQARGDLLLKGRTVVDAKRRTNYENSRQEDPEQESPDKKVESSPLLPSGEHIIVSYDIPVEHHSVDSSASAPLQPLVFLYRGILIQLAFVIPVGLWWMKGIEPLLLYLGQEEKLAVMTASYLRILAPGLWAYSVNWTLTSWLQAISIADVPAWAAFVGFLMHIPSNILFVDIIGWGYLGVAMATVVFQLLQPLIICIFLFGTEHGRKRVLRATGAEAIGRTHFSFITEFCEALHVMGIKQYLSLALPGIVIISEWWASEVGVFLSGRLHPDPEYDLGAMSIYQTINTFFFMFPIGFSASSSARVGLYLGMNDSDGAKLASNVSILFAGIFSFIMSCVLMFTPHTLFPSIFTSDQNVVQLTARTIPFLAVYVFADGIQVALNGVIKGCGRQSVVMPVVVFAYWVVGIPLAYYNSFRIHDGTTLCDVKDISCGVLGIVLAMTVATWVHCLILFWVVSFAIRWDKEASLAQQRMAEARRHSVKPS